MRIKNHPRAIVEVYVDGRTEVFFNEMDTENLTLKDVIKQGLIIGTVRNLHHHCEKDIERGRYELTMTKFKMFKRNAGFDLKPI